MGKPKQKAEKKRADTGYSSVSHASKTRYRPNYPKQWQPPWNNYSNKKAVLPWWRQRSNHWRSVCVPMHWLIRPKLQSGWSANSLWGLLWPRLVSKRRTNKQRHIKSNVWWRQVITSNAIIDNTRSQADPLTTMYSKLLSFATNDLQPLLDITQRALRGTNYEILVNSFFVEAMVRINQECSSIYAPGQTDTFHKVMSRWPSSCITPPRSSNIVCVSRIILRRCLLFPGLKLYVRRESHCCICEVIRGIANLWSGGNLLYISSFGMRYTEWEREKWKANLSG